MAEAKPDFKEVYAYALKSIQHFIEKRAKRLAPEIKEEISQEALMRVWTAYQKIEADRGWKSFVQMHCQGSVLDYMKSGKISTESEYGSKAVEFTVDMEDSDSPSFESTISYFGIHSESGREKKPFTPNWELVSRMAGRDDNLHIIAKMLLGFTQKQIAEQMITVSGATISRERVSQRLYEYFDKFDDPEYFGDPWTEQSIFALGLSAYYHMKEVDNGVGWAMSPVNLHCSGSFRDAWARFGEASRSAMLSLFDWKNGEVAKEARRQGYEVVVGEYSAENVALDNVRRIPAPKPKRGDELAEQLTLNLFESSDVEMGSMNRPSYNAAASTAR